MIFITPSYRGDLERVILLRRSIARFYNGKANHIILVPKEDISIFKENINELNVDILEQNSYLDRLYYPNFIYLFISKYFPNQKWRIKQFGGKSGWITQQIIKLAAPSYTSERTIVILDSDIIFLKEFDDDAFTQKNKMLLMKSIPTLEAARHRSHMENSRKLLRLPQGTTEHHYMAWPAIFQLDWLRALHEYLEAQYKQPWQKVLFNADTLSEYCLYGVFVEEILKPLNLKIQSKPNHIGIWSKTEFFETLESIEETSIKNTANSKVPLCLVVQSNLGIPTTEYEAVVNRILDGLSPTLVPLD